MVGPDGPVDARAAAKIEAAKTTASPKPVNSQNNPQTAPPMTATHLIETTKASNAGITLPISNKQTTLRCDCCAVTVNSQHQLDLHLNGKKSEM